MNKKDIVDSMKPYFADSKEAEKAVDIFINLITQALKRKEKVMISSFGTFIPIEKKPALRRNPKTNEKVMTSVRKKVRFKPSRKLISSI
ncbi:MAG: DNA-binding protein [Elusimicrobia bacterium]|nr:DNA-binding protein [Elusimicrobiota bacterium]